MSRMIPEKERKNFLPDYALTPGSSPEEVRKTAVRAMRNELFYPWTPYETLRYHKEGYCSSKEYLFEKNALYAGLPYSDAGGSLIQFLQYFDPKTGTIRLTDPENADHLIGNMCGESVIWAVAATCPAVCGGMQSGFMTTHQGFFPAGKWKLDPKIETYLDYSTVSLSRDNGKDVMMQCYAKAKPGYLLCCSAEAGNSHNHAAMILAEPHVEYLPDGSINELQSYLIAQDQRSGKKAGGFEVLRGGRLYQMMGVGEAVYTFRHLWDFGFVTLATAEMLGKKKPSRAEVFIETREDGTLKGFLSGAVKSNFILCTLRLTVKDENQNEVYRSFHNLATPDIVAGRAWKQELGVFEPKLKKGVYHVVLEALPVNGEKKVFRRKLSF